MNKAAFIPLAGLALFCSIASAADTVAPIIVDKTLESTEPAQAKEMAESLCKRISNKLASVGYQECAV
jgi:hypothetical protein